MAISNLFEEVPFSGDIDLQVDLSQVDQQLIDAQEDPDVERVTVNIILITADGELLTLLSGGAVNDYEFNPTFLGGGHDPVLNESGQIVRYETARETVRRELKEELDLEPTDYVLEQYLGQHRAAPRNAQSTGQKERAYFYLQVRLLPHAKFRVMEDHKFVGYNLTKIDDIHAMTRLVNRVRTERRADIAQVLARAGIKIT